MSVHPGVAGGDRFETTLTVPYTMVEDTWFVVLVKGTDGASEPMFPEMPASLGTSTNLVLADLVDGNLSEGGVMALGHTNALYLDIDGNAQYDHPGVTVGVCP